MPTWKKTCHYGTLADINSWIYFFFQNQLLASTNNLKNRETWFVGYLLVAENWFCRQGCHRKAQPEPHGSWLNPFRRARNVGKFLQVSAPLCAPKKGWDQVACNGFFIVPILLSISQYLCVIFVNLRVQKKREISCRERSTFLLQWSIHVSWYSEVSLWYAQFSLGNTTLDIIFTKNHLRGKFFRNFWMLITWNGRRVGGMFSVGENGQPSRSNASGRFLWLQNCTTERWGNDETVSFSGKNFRIETWRNQQFHSYESRLLQIFCDYSSFPQHVFFWC